MTVLHLKFKVDFFIDLEKKIKKINVYLFYYLFIFQSTQNSHHNNKPREIMNNNLDFAWNLFICT